MFRIKQALDALACVQPTFRFARASSPVPPCAKRPLLALDKFLK